ncbi:DUF3301 domain-containing protein [Microbulbifer sp. ZKSA004]|uniref:DUF3301 domain-containing protein n=1 Tax=Microbulbifer sp. ZKSA004 TaxID=3243389 RepID=UPI00403A44FC
MVFLRESDHSNCIAMYYTLSDILWLSLFFVVLWYIWASMAAKEHVRRAASDHCRQLGVQLLDDTVLLVRTRVKKDKRGFFSLHRSYKFEFTSTGEHRYSGTAVLHGNRIQQLQLAPHHVS